MKGVRNKLRALDYGPKLENGFDALPIHIQDMSADKEDEIWELLCRRHVKDDLFLRGKNETG